MTSNQTIRWVVKPSVFVAALGPLVWLIWAALAGQLSAVPLPVPYGDAGQTVDRLEQRDPVPADVRPVRLLLRVTASAHVCGGRPLGWPRFLTWSVRVDDAARSGSLGGGRNLQKDVHH